MRDRRRRLKPPLPPQYAVRAHSKPPLHVGKALGIHGRSRVGVAREFALQPVSQQQRVRLTDQHVFALDDVPPQPLGLQQRVVLVGIDAQIAVGPHGQIVHKHAGSGVAFPP